MAAAGQTTRRDGLVLLDGPDGGASGRRSGMARASGEVLMCLSRELESVDAAARRPARGHAGSDGPVDRYRAQP